MVGHTDVVDQGVLESVDTIDVEDHGTPKSVHIDSVRFGREVKKIGLDGSRLIRTFPDKMNQDECAQIPKFGQTMFVQMEVDKAKANCKFLELLKIGSNIRALQLKKDQLQIISQEQIAGIFSGVLGEMDLNAAEMRNTREDDI